MVKSKNNKMIPVKLSLEEKRLLETYNRFRIKSNTEVPVEQYVFMVDGVGCMPLGDISAIKAPAKQGKTTVIKKIIATVLKGESGHHLTSDLKRPLVVWCDTEQQIGDAKLIIQDIRKMTGITYKSLDKHLMVFSLRKIDCTSILDQLKVAIKSYQPHVVVLDGIAEFVHSVNDEIEANNLVHQLMVLAEEYHCAIIVVMHENRSGNREMNGHLGANLTKKVAVVLGCTKSGDVITVKCAEHRHQSVPNWSVRFDDQGNIVDADDYISPISRNASPSSRPNKKQQTEKKKKEILLRTLQEAGGSIARKDLNEKLEAKLNLARTTVANLISDKIKDGTLVETSGLIQVNPQMSVGS